MRRWWLWTAAAVVVIVGLSVWVFWPSSAPPPRARPYLEFTACLLTDGQGLAGAQAAAVWSGMQDASLSTHAKVQYLQAVGPDTKENAAPYLASLVQRKCAVVVAVGQAQVDAVAADATKYPAVRFVVVGVPGSGSNVTSIDSSVPSDVRSRVAKTITDAVHAAGGS
jgi:hypothetical protein